MNIIFLELPTSTSTESPQDFDVSYPALPICRSSDYKSKFIPLSKVHFPWIEDQQLDFLHFCSQQQSIPKYFEDENALRSSLIHDFVCADAPFITGGNNPIFILIKKIQWNCETRTRNEMIVIPGPLHHQFELVRVASRSLKGTGILDLLGESNAVTIGRCNAMRVWTMPVPFYRQPAIA
ncbi:hypothetical protein Ciccas_013182 [Cichlidogyrus casuarinus]|uniref:Uncharacterized protein n=1 Tax=Cichlidogyrus casuarinus TaxID=1844966 RepID=A0ABD2PN33_9PLAT